MRLVCVSCAREAVTFGGAGKGTRGARIPSASQAQPARPLAHEHGAVVPSGVGQQKVKEIKEGCGFGFLLRDFKK